MEKEAFPMNQPTTFVLVRHGECDGNTEGRFRGRKDFPLNHLGIQQAQQAGEAASRLGLSQVYTSPLLRATQTAKAIAEACGVRSQECPDLINISLGPWEGRTKDEVAREEPALWDIWLRSPEDLSFPGMEPLESVRERTLSLVNRLARHHDGETVALVTHRTVLKPLVAACLGMTKPWFWKFHFDTASLSLLVHDQRGYALTALNRTDHLSRFVPEWN